MCHKQFSKQILIQIRNSFRFKMSYGKDDFLDWDDEELDLGALLGEYTCFDLSIISRYYNKHLDIIFRNVVKYYIKFL